MTAKILVEIEGLFIYPTKGAPDQHYVLLRNTNGQSFAIFVGWPEMQSMNYAFHERCLLRPLTHDAMVACIEGLGGIVQHIFLHAIKNEVYHSSVYLASGDKTITVEMRPSDALNLALRAKCPIYVADEVLAAGVATYKDLETQWSQEGPVECENTQPRAS
ncbi:MAG: bifunctional nuclease family protein [Capsulimonas sp.]|uniref:bifunctional nuclease family protein n=1 Tax=Capsulimonas sp. TaxID=2494211 RepID=UPI003263E5DA